MALGWLNSQTVNIAKFLVLRISKKNSRTPNLLEIDITIKNSVFWTKIKRKIQPVREEKSLYIWKFCCPTTLVFTAFNRKTNCSYRVEAKWRVINNNVNVDNMRVNWYKYIDISGKVGSKLYFVLEKLGMRFK